MEQKKNVFVFQRGAHRFATEVTNVLEISPIVEVIALPAVPTQVIGLVSTAHGACPVVDLGSWLSDIAAAAESEQEDLSSERFLILETDEGLCAVLADQVFGILSLSFSKTETQLKSPWIPYESSAEQNSVQYIDVTKMSTELKAEISAQRGS